MNKFTIKIEKEASGFYFAYLYKWWFPFIPLECGMGYSTESAKKRVIEKYLSNRVVDRKIEKIKF